MPAFLLQPITKYLSIGIVSIMLLVGAYVKGRSDGHDLVVGQIDSQRLEWQQKVHNLQLEHQREVDDLATEYVKDVTILSIQIEKLKKTPRIITKYIPVQVDKAVPNGLVSLHDRAGMGKDLDDEVSDAASPSNVKLSEFGVTVSENYTSCLVDRKRLAALQEVVRKFREAQEGLVK